MKMGIKKDKGITSRQKPEGLHTLWYENGNKKSEVTFSNGKPNGPSVAWYANGNKREEGENKEGNQFGKWIYYNLCLLYTSPSPRD